MKEKLFFHEFYADINGNKNIIFSNNNKFIKMTELSFKKNLFSYDSKTFFTKVEDIINDFLSKDGIVNTEDYIYEFNNERIRSTFNGDYITIDDGNGKITGLFVKYGEDKKVVEIIEKLQNIIFSDFFSIFCVINIKDITIKNKNEVVISLRAESDDNLAKNIISYLERSGVKGYHISVTDNEYIDFGVYIDKFVCPDCFIDDNVCNIVYGEHFQSSFIKDKHCYIYNTGGNTRILAPTKAEEHINFTHFTLEQDACKSKMWIWSPIHNCFSEIYALLLEEEKTMITLGAAYSTAINMINDLDIIQLLFDKNLTKNSVIKKTSIFSQNYMLTINLYIQPDYSLSPYNKEDVLTELKREFYNTKYSNITNINMDTSMSHEIEIMSKSINICQEGIAFSFLIKYSELFPYDFEDDEDYLPI